MPTKPLLQPHELSDSQKELKASERPKERQFGRWSERPGAEFWWKKLAIPEKADRLKELALNEVHYILFTLSPSLFILPLRRPYILLLTGGVKA